ncbi:mitochondrial carrier homolog 1-like [Lissotriton helveticus]
MAASGAARASGQEESDQCTFEATDSLYLLMGAAATALPHPLLYVKVLIQVGHEPTPASFGRNHLERKVSYLPGYSIYARYIVEVDGNHGLFRGLTPRIISSTLSTISRGALKKAYPWEDLEHVSNKDDVKISLRKVVKESSSEMMVQCLSRIISHPLHVISVHCMVQFIGREVKYSGVFGFISAIYKEERIMGFFHGLVPHILGEVIFWWCCILLSHFINAYTVDDNFIQAFVTRSYRKFVMGIAVNLLTYPLFLVGDLMAVNNLNNCGLAAGLPPYSPVYTSWTRCWKQLSSREHLFRGSSLFFRQTSSGACLSLH